METWTNFPRSVRNDDKNKDKTVKSFLTTLRRHLVNGQNNEIPKKHEL